MLDIKKEFKNPSTKFRSMAFWVWNGNVSENRITEMLEQFKKVGIGGGFVHPRQGLVTEYLSERWFELWHWEHTVPHPQPFTRRWKASFRLAFSKATDSPP
jgi:hypothetical protein